MKTQRIAKAAVGGFGLIILLGSVAALPVGLYTGWVGCQTTGDWIRSQRVGEPTSLSFAPKAVCSVFGLSGVPQLAGLATKYVMDTDTDVQTPYQVRNDIK